LVEHQLGRVVDTMTAATASRCGRAVFVLAEQALDLGADLRLGRAAVGPVDREVGADALDQLVGDRRQRQVGLYVLDAAGEAS
jgi:hypothetical protein